MNINDLRFINTQSHNNLSSPQTHNTQPHLPVCVRLHECHSWRYVQCWRWSPDSTWWCGLSDERTPHKTQTIYMRQKEKNLHTESTHSFHEYGPDQSAETWTLGCELSALLRILSSSSPSLFSLFPSHSNVWSLCRLVCVIMVQYLLSFLVNCGYCSISCCSSWSATSPLVFTLCTWLYPFWEERGEEGKEGAGGRGDERIKVFGHLLLKLFPSLHPPHCPTSLQYRYVCCHGN